MELEAGEVATVEATVSCAQAVGLLGGVGTDEEVGDEPLSPTAASPVGAPSLTGRESRRRAHWVEIDCEPFERVTRCGRGRKHARNLGPDDIARDEPARSGASSQRSG